MQQRLDAFVGNRSFKVSAEMPDVNAPVHSLTLVSLVVPQDTLTSDASQVMKIICDPEAAFADRPPRQGWVRIARSLCLHCSIVTAEPCVAGGVQAAVPFRRGGLLVQHEGGHLTWRRTGVRTSKVFAKASQRLIHLAVDRMWLNCFAYGCLIVDMARPPLRFCWDGSVVCQC